MAKKNKSEIAVVEQKLPKEFTGSGDLPLGTDSIGAEDIILPRIRVIQPQSQDRDEGEGKLKNSVTAEIHEKITFVPLMVIGGRLHFPKEEMFSPPDCRSSDRVIGTGTRLEELNLSCQFCGFSGTKKGLKKQGLKKEDLKAEIERLEKEGKICHLCDGFPCECAECLEYPILLDGLLCGLSFKRTGISEAKKLNTIVKLRNIPFFFLKPNLATEFVKGRKGQFYVPRLEVIGKTSEEERHLAAKYVRELIEKRVEVDYSFPDFVE